MRRRLTLAVSEALVLAGLGSWSHAAPTATTWIGGDGDWFTASNWSNGVPSATVNGKYAIFTSANTVTSAPSTYPGVNGVSFEGTGGFNLNVQPLYVVDDSANPAFLRVTQANQASPYVITSLANVVASSRPVSVEIASGSTLRTSIASHGIWTLGRYGTEGDGGTLEFVSSANLGRNLTGLTINNNATFRNGLAGNLPILNLSGGGTLISGNTTGNYSATTVLRANAFNYSGTLRAQTTRVDTVNVASGAFSFDLVNGGTTFNGGTFYLEANANGGATVKSAEATRGLVQYSATDTNHDMTLSETQINGNGQMVFRWGSYWSTGGNGTLTINDVSLRPGINNVGILTHYGNLAASDDADAVRNTLLIEVAGGGAVAGTDYDRLELLKAHTSGGGVLTSVGSSNQLANLAAEVRISDALAPASVIGDTLRFLTTGNNLTGASFSDVKVYYGNTLLPASDYALVYSGNATSGYAEVTINGITIPEPAAMALVGICGLALLPRRSRAGRR